MELPKRTDFTADEFIAWALDQSEGRFELSDGMIVAMAPERVGHVRAKLRVVNALGAAIAAGRLECEAITDGIAVRIGEHSVYEPDALVRCGPPLPDSAVEAPDPVVVVEVLSPSTAGVDMGAKLEGYSRVPSIRHYLIVHPERRFVIHHRRVATGPIETTILRDGTITLDPPGLAVAVADLVPAV